MGHTHTNLPWFIQEYSVIYTHSVIISNGFECGISSLF